MRIVLDTNVLVAGLLSPFGPCGEIVRMVSSGEPALCFDARILSEVNDVLKRPKTPEAEVIHPPGKGTIPDTGPSTIGGSNPRIHTFNASRPAGRSSP